MFSARGRCLSRSFRTEKTERKSRWRGRRRVKRAARSLGDGGQRRPTAGSGSGGGRRHGARRIVRRRPNAQHADQPFTDIDVDAAIPKNRPPIRRRVGNHRRSHANASGHSVRVVGRTRSARE